MPASASLGKIGCSLVDQGLSVGGGFLSNIALARELTKEQYGVFALTYSLYVFLLGLYSAALLEPATIFGSGRFRERFPEYARLILRSNATLCLYLTGVLLSASFGLSWLAPHLASKAVWGLALTTAVLLSSYLVRRLFYVQRQPGLAAMTSLVFFLTFTGELWILTNMHRIDSFSVFAAMAVAWIAAWALLGPRLQIGSSAGAFLTSEPGYWRTHWKYSKWALATALVYQFTQQGYYWLVGIFLSPAETANLRAMYLLVGPVDQVLMALSYLMVPALAAHAAAREMHKFLSLWKKYALGTVALSASYALLTRVAGRIAVHFLYAGKYDGLVPYLFVLTLVPLVLWLGTTMGHALNSIEKPKFQFWAFVTSAGATFTVGIPLVLHFGLWGAVYGMLVSSGTYAFTLALCFLKIFRKSWIRPADLICIDS